MSLDEINRAGLEALMCELGPEGYVRFLQQFDQGSGDYTAERRVLRGSPTVEELAEAIRRRRDEEQAPS
jgi:hypothetical protein